MAFTTAPEVKLAAGEAIRIIREMANATEAVEYLHFIEEDLKHYFIPYGTIAWVDNALNLYIWASLTGGKVPLKSSKTIKFNKLVAMYFAITWVLLPIAFTAVQFNHIKTKEIQYTIVGHIMATFLTHFVGLATMKARATQPGGNDKKVEGADMEANNEIALQEAHQKEETHMRRSMDSVTSTFSSTAVSVVVDTSEEKGFLDDDFNKIPSARNEETNRTNEESCGESHVSKTSMGITDCLVLAFVFLGLSPGYVMMFSSMVQIANIVAKLEGNEKISRKQQDMREAFVLPAALFLIVVSLLLMSLVATYIPERNQDRKEIIEEEEISKKAPKSDKVFGILWIFGTAVGVSSLWNQFMVIATVARDTHGIAHLGQLENLRLVYIILPKLCLLAW